MTKYKAWYIPQVPMKAFEFETEDLLLAGTVLDQISEFSAFEFNNNIKPDYFDVAGISRWEEDGEGGYDWFDLDDYEQEEILQSEGRGN